MPKKLAGYCMGQIQVVFSLPVDEAQVPSECLGYVEWFSKFTLPESNHGIHKVKHSVENGRHVASIVPLSSIHHKALLFPKFDHEVPEDWTLDSVLEKCNTF